MLLVAWASACSTVQAADPSHAPARKVPGVVLDPGFAFPRSRESGPSAETLVSLQSPVPRSAALRLIERFFETVVRGDLDSLSRLCTEDATVPGRKRNGPIHLVDFWRARMRVLSYRGLLGRALFDRTKVDWYGYADLGAPAGLGPEVRSTEAATRFGPPLRPEEMTQGDLLVRVPMSVVRATGGERLFADEVFFLLRPLPDDYRIRVVFEEFQLP